MDLLPCGRYLLAPLTRNKEGSMWLMVLRVRPTPTRFPTNILYSPVDSTPLLSLPPFVIQELGILMSYSQHSCVVSPLKVSSYAASFAPSPSGGEILSTYSSQQTSQQPIPSANESQKPSGSILDQVYKKPQTLSQVGCRQYMHFEFVIKRPRSIFVSRYIFF